MVQLPGVVVEGDSGFVAGHGFPAVVPEPAMPGHLEVLDLFAGGGPSIGERVGEGGPADRDLLETSPHCGRLYIYKVINRGGDVVDVMELPPHPIPHPIPHPARATVRRRAASRAASKTGGPMHHQGDMHSAFMRVLLVPLEWGVADLRPAPGVVGVGVWPADLVEVRHRFVGRFEDPVEEFHLVEHPERPALLRRAVVAEHHDDGVVEFAERGEVVD